MSSLSLRAATGDGALDRPLALAGGGGGGFGEAGSLLFATLATSSRVLVIGPKGRLWMQRLVDLLATTELTGMAIERSDPFRGR